MEIDKKKNPLGCNYFEVPVLRDWWYSLPCLSTSLYFSDSLDFSYVWYSKLCSLVLKLAVLYYALFDKFDYLFASYILLASQCKT
jgi:hypothetical protein